VSGAYTSDDRKGFFAKSSLRVPQPWLWLALLICTVVAGLYPVGYRLIRAVMILASVVIVVWGLYLVRRRKTLVTLMAAACALSLVFVCLPGARRMRRRCARPM
jgi:hypothetical protein